MEYKLKPILEKMLTEYIQEICGDYQCVYCGVLVRSESLKHDNDCIIPEVEMILSEIENTSPIIKI